MNHVLADGISTRYAMRGFGPPLLMFSPGGFDARLEKWSELGQYARIKLIDHLSSHYTCIFFDRRETGLSGGRIERITWENYVAQAKGLLDHLGIEKAHLIGGCLGCSSAAAFAVAHPQRSMSLTLHWPVGGARYRINSQRRFLDHLAFVRRVGMEGVVELLSMNPTTFATDSRSGPWASVITSDEGFAAAFNQFNSDDYELIILGMARLLVDSDTPPGAAAEDLMRLRVPSLIIPGDDQSHATSAARYLHECLPNSEYWDVRPDEQTEDRVATCVLNFLENCDARSS